MVTPSTSTIFLVLIFALAPMANAQYGRNDYNLKGLFFGATTPTVITQNLAVAPGKGLTGGYISRGDVYNNFDISYAMVFFQNQCTIQGRNNNISGDVIMELSGAQIQLLGGYQIIRHHLSLDMGPVLSFNGPWRAQSKDQELWQVSGYDQLVVEDLSGVSPVQGHFLIGLSGGLERLKLTAQYQRGFSNFLRKINNTNLERPVNGFSGQLAWTTIGVYLYF